MTDTEYEDYEALITSEGWKRFRNPELRPLFLRLLRNSDWRTTHVWSPTTSGKSCC